MLINSGPDLSDYVLLQHFFCWVSKESALFLHIAARGSFSRKNTQEGREILNRILENYSYADDLNKHLKAILKIDETSTVEPEPLNSSIEPPPEILLHFQNV